MNNGQHVIKMNEWPRVIDWNATPHTIEVNGRRRRWPPCQAGFRNLPKKIRYRVDPNIMETLPDDETETVPEQSFRKTMNGGTTESFTKLLSSDSNTSQPSTSKRRRVHSPAALLQEEGSSQMSGQFQSHLLRLPAEVRELIWREIFSSTPFLHVRYDQGKLSAVACSRCAEMPRDSLLHHLSRSTAEYCKPEKRKDKSETCPDRSVNLFDTLLSCRQIWQEASRFFYLVNTLDFEGIDALMHLHRLIPFQPLNEVEVLHLQWEFKVPWTKHRVCGTGPNSYNAKPPYDLATWTECCAVLGSMKNLQQLYILLSGIGIDSQSPMYYSTFQPLRSIQGVKVFKVSVPTLLGQYIFSEKLPFELIRRPWPMV